jgi:DNA-binding winged helix-turn-helix (wHTH) protein/predicted ATPase
VKPVSPLSFPPFRLDPVNECLWREGQRIPLRGKTFRVLCCLLKHSGQLVTKAELFKAVWPDTAVGDAVLMTCISELRQALGDDARTPRFIETVHRRGYYFIAPVQSSKFQVPSSRSKPTLSPQSPTPSFTGREAESAQLHKWLEKALDGARQIVFVSGEAGIGKTSLVDTFVARVGADPHIWVARGQCVEQYGASEAYQPVLEALERLCRKPGHERFVQLLRQSAPLWLRQMPALLSSKDRLTLQREILGATQERMLREIVTLLEAFAAEVPLVLWLEDLHWSDPSTLTLLALLARRREAARLLVIATYRPIEVLGDAHLLRPVLQELQGRGLCTELTLKGLSKDAITEYLTARFAGWAQHPVPLQQVAQALHQRTEGNPLLLVTVLEDLVARGMIVQTECGWTLQGGGDAVTVGVPQSLQQIIERQIDRLSLDQQRLLEAASVAGTEFSAAAVAAALETDVEQVEDCCDKLVRQHLFLQARGQDVVPDRRRAARYGFRHTLYREVVYTQVTAGRRARLHRRVGEWAEAAYGERAQKITAELAVHFAQGRDYRRAVQYHGQAAETAIQRYAYQEAVSHLSHALELLKTLPESLERDWQELMLQFTLYIQLGKLKGEATTEVEGAVARVRELSQRVEQTPEVFWALAGIYPFYLVREELQTARALAEQALQLAQRFLAPPLLLAAHTELGIACFFLGQFTVARTHLEKAIAHYAPSSSLPLSFDWDHGPPCLCYSAFVLWHLGYPDQALQQSQKALAKVQALRLPYMQAFVLNFAARLHQLRREGDAVQRYAATALRLATEHGFAGMAEVGRILSGWALAESSKGEEGVAQIRQSLTAFQANGGAAFRAYYLALLAEACSKAGQVEEGLTVVTEALAVVARTGGRYYEAELYRLKGTLTLQSRQVENKSKTSRGQVKDKSQVANPQPPAPNSQAEAEAEACFLKAIDIAHRQSAKSLELRAVMSLSRLWQQQGKKKQAHKMLAEIYNWFTEGFDTADLQEAKALLEELSH